MKRLIVLSTLLFMILCRVSSQDLIIKNDKTELKSKITEVLSSEIKYKKWEMLDGPIYTINKTDIFMIIYQNGTRETFETAKKISNTNQEILITEGNTTASKNKNKAPVDLAITFMPKNKFVAKPTKEQRKDKEFLKEYAKSTADRSVSFGINLMNIGKSTVPTIMFLTDVTIAKNIAITWGFGFNYHREKFSGYKYSMFTYWLPIGAVYYFNQLLKIKKQKASLYAGVLLTPSISSINIKSDETYSYSSSSSSSSKFNFNGGLRVGASYNFVKKFGVYADILVGKGRPGILVGLKLSNFREK